jgi:hypothetical protein
MKKETFAKHTVASREVKNAFIALVKAITNAPKDTNISVTIKTKGGYVKDIDLEYLSVCPFIGHLDSDYRRVFADNKDLHEKYREELDN